MVQRIGRRAAAGHRLGPRPPRAPDPGDRGPARVRGRRARPRRDGRSGRRPGAAPVRGGCRPGGGGKPRVRLSRPRPRLGPAVPLRHRARPGRRLPDRAQAAGGLVPPRAGPGDRRPRRRPHHRIGAAVPASGARREPGARLAGDRRRREHPGDPRWGARARRGGRRAVGRAGSAVQPRCRAGGLPRAIGPPRQPRLPGPHVGALRDVDLGAALRGRELRGGRDPVVRDRPAWPPSRSSGRAGSAASSPASSPIGWAARP